MLRRIQQPQPGTPGRTPYLFDKCTGFFCMHYTTHGTNGFMSHPKDEAMAMCLLKGSGLLNKKWLLNKTNKNPMNIILHKYTLLNKSSTADFEAEK